MSVKLVVDIVKLSYMSSNVLCIVATIPAFASVGFVILLVSTAPSFITRIFFVVLAAVTALAYVSFAKSSVLPSLESFPETVSR